MCTNHFTGLTICLVYGSRKHCTPISSRYRGMKEIGFKVQLNKEIDKNPFSVTPWYTLVM